MKYIDIHSHINFAVYNDDREKIIEKTKEDDVLVINIGTQQTTSKNAVEISNENDNYYSMVGLHPIHTVETYHDYDELGDQEKEFTSSGEVFDKDFYKELISSSDKVVGIGECGFDYYRIDESTKKIQERAFRDQIELALETNLPLMLHIRPSVGSYDAYYDALSLLKEYKKSNENLIANVHFFAGTKEIAQEFINLGFYISFTGVITFTDDYESLIKEIPIDRILSETDSPYVSPIPFRGKRNEPSNVREVVKKIAEIKDLDEDYVAKQIMSNAKKLFNIK